MRTGQLRKRVTFEREDTESTDALGDPVGGVIELGTVWGRVEPLRGDERVAASAIEASFEFRLHVRLSELTASVTEADQVKIDTIPHQIRSIYQTEKPEFIVMNIERGGA